MAAGVVPDKGGWHRRSSETRAQPAQGDARAQDCRSPGSHTAACASPSSASPMGESRPRAFTGGLARGTGSSEPESPSGSFDPAPSIHPPLPEREDLRPRGGGDAASLQPPPPHPAAAAAQSPPARPQPRSPRRAAAANAAGGREEPQLRLARQAAGAALRSRTPVTQAPGMLLSNPRSSQPASSPHQSVTHPQ